MLKMDSTMVMGRFLMSLVMALPNEFIMVAINLLCKASTISVSSSTCCTRPRLEECVVGLMNNLWTTDCLVPTTGKMVKMETAGIDQCESFYNYQRRTNSEYPTI